MKFTATQQDALVLCAESQGAVVVDDDLGSSELDVPVGQPSLQGDHLQNILRNNRFAVLGSGEPGSELQGPRTTANQVHTFQGCPYLATRIGPQVEGAPIPSAVGQQRWSLMNMPIMWAAAGQEQNTQVVNWFVLTLQMHHR